MSVIENPTAYLNETNPPECDEETSPAKPAGAPKKVRATKPSSEMMNETPLTSDKEKTHSPRQLNCTVETTVSATSEDKLCTVSDLPDLSLSSQLGGQGVSPGKSEKHEPAAGGSGQNNILALAEGLESDESDDEEYAPGLDPMEKEDEEEEKGEGEEVVARQYSLRDGVKGTIVEEAKEVSHDEVEKKKADDLWSAFKADVAVPIKRKAKVIETTLRERTYDFAGEAITVKEEIKSKRRSIASTLGLDRKRRRESAPILSRGDEEEEKHSEEGSTTSDPSNSTVTGVKRARPVSKLNSLVNRLTKRPKMTVLNKTSLDWNKFKKENAIEEDVKNEAKAEGYLEKQDFLNRSDHKQFELEREIRAQQARRRQMMNPKQF